MRSEQIAARDGRNLPVKRHGAQTNTHKLGCECLECAGISVTQQGKARSGSRGFGWAAWSEAERAGEPWGAWMARGRGAGMWGGDVGRECGAGTWGGDVGTWGGECVLGVDEAQDLHLAQDESALHERERPSHPQLQAASATQAHAGAVRREVRSAVRIRGLRIPSLA